MKGFDNLEPKQKKQIIWALIGLVLFILIMAGYNMRSQRTVGLDKEHATKTVELEPDLIQKTMLREQRREIDDLKAEIKAMKDTQAQELRKHSDEVKKTAIPSAEEITKTTPAAEKQKWPLPLNSEGRVIPNRSGVTPPPTTGTINSEPVMIGEIAIISNPKAEEILEDPKKKEGPFISHPHLWKRAC